MKFGIFDHVDASGLPLAEHYETRLRLVEAMDRLGFAGYHIAEHHGTPLGTSPSPSVYLAAVAQRTKRLRFGPLVYLPALYHPIRLAEEICMLDQISRGRLLVGIGRGGVFLEQQIYGVEPAEVPERYDEAVTILLQALAGDVSFTGKHYAFPYFPMVLKPYQKPHPPLWYGIGNPETAVWAAANAVNVVSLAPAKGAAPILFRYREEWDKLGKPAAALPALGLSRQVVVAATDAEARRIASAAYPAWRASFGHLWEAMGAHHPLLDARPRDWDGYQEGGTGIAGSPATVIEYLREQRAATGATYVACQMVFGTMAYEDALGSLELFAREVMPALAAPAAVPA
ncbi:MAG TPA: LLM class flavin-dependent oxidoreductase [Hyphomicrobiales bacterium]|nr:LLM class flavin-dependent oxidoreductase [Hyphomicrobiales bacterium]